jgi:hypothetical protein
MLFRSSLKFFTYILTLIFITQCGMYKKVDTRQVPTNAQERARQAVNEGKGLGIKNILGGNSGFEFSTSNPLWRASLETLDFLPLANVDYAGGVIITDWYSADIGNDESLKISLQFLSNEIRTDSIKINVYKKVCEKNNKCNTFKTKSNQIELELKKSILKLAAIKEKEDKNKK